MWNNDVLLLNFLLIYKKKFLNLIFMNMYKWYIYRRKFFFLINGDVCRKI